MINVMKCLYSDFKSCVQMHSTDYNDNFVLNTSEMFNCNSGLLEGECLSPLLYSLYVNDLKEYLLEKECAGVSDVSTIENDLMLFVKLLLIMYADDTVLFATTKKELQLSLSAYAEYCKKWKLIINVSKTKIMYFGRKQKCKFTMNEEEIEIVDTFKY